MFSVTFTVSSLRLKVLQTRSAAMSASRAKTCASIEEAATEAAMRGEYSINFRLSEDLKWQTAVDDIVSDCTALGLSVTGDTVPGGYIVISWQPGA